jgi:hypothetical protein
MRIFPNSVTEKQGVTLQLNTTLTCSAQMFLSKNEHCEGKAGSPLIFKHMQSVLDDYGE